MFTPDPNGIIKIDRTQQRQLKLALDKYVKANNGKWAGFAKEIWIDGHRRYIKNKGSRGKIDIQFDTAVARNRYANKRARAIAKNLTPLESFERAALKHFQANGITTIQYGDQVLNAKEFARVKRAEMLAEILEKEGYIKGLKGDFTKGHIIPALADEVELKKRGIVNIEAAETFRPEPGKGPGANFSSQAKSIPSDDQLNALGIRFTNHDEYAEQFMFGGEMVDNPKSAKFVNRVLKGDIPGAIEDYKRSLSTIGENLRSLPTDRYARMAAIRNLTALGSLGFSAFGTVVDAKEAHARYRLAKETGRLDHWIQAGGSVIEGVAGVVGAEMVAQPIAAANMTRDLQQMGIGQTDSSFVPAGPMSLASVKAEKEALLQYKKEFPTEYEKDNTIFGLWSSIWDRSDRSLNIARVDDVKYPVDHALDADDRLWEMLMKDYSKEDRDELEQAFPGRLKGV